MTMAETYDLKALLVPYHQEHLVRFLDRLDARQQEQLGEEIHAIHFAQLDQLYRQPDQKDRVRALADRAQEPPSFRMGDRQNRISPDEAVHRGEDALRAGEVAVMLVAGGQGTRLGFDAPKGMFPIGPISNKPLFQIHVEKILASSVRHHRRIPLCVMTSPATHEATIAFFRENHRFGLAEDDLRIFCQGTMPAVEAATGKVLLDQPHHLALSPDGHGGMLAALARSGLIDELRGRGFKYLFYFQVDNPLVQICNPEFLGYHLLSGSEMTTQVVAKETPLDRVGNVVRVDDRLHVIEYSDLPNEVAERRKPDGSLEIWAGSIAVHAMNLDFLARMADQADAMPFHVAHKKVPFIDAVGKRITPKEPNAIKFERFIFDLLPWAERAVVVEVDPNRHFAPLKNAPGATRDTPEWVRQQMIALHAEWLRQAGAEVANVPVEISPLFALDAAEVAQKIRPGTKVDKPTYLTPGLI
jgi:UDP-N-acetylglucosamine/UDP-N-acetylgalactosamine diphosphorylase